MSKKTKNLLLLVLAVVVLVFGISRLRIQSVSDYQKESEGLSKQLQLEEEISVAVDEINKEFSKQFKYSDRIFFKFTKILYAVFFSIRYSIICNVAKIF